MIKRAYPLGLLLVIAGCIGDWSQRGEQDGGTQASEAGVEPSSADADVAPDNAEADASVQDAGDEADALDAITADAGWVLGADAEQARNDASTQGMGDTQDAGPDAATPVRSAAIASVDTACDTPPELACSAHNVVQKLACLKQANGSSSWTFTGSCDGPTRCDTRFGVTQGTCQTITARCLGKQPGTAICDGTARKRCGLDLLDEPADPCPAFSHCEGADATCVCDRGYTSSAAGCVDIPDCPANACADGRCVDAVESYSCACNSGFRPTADGKRCEDIPNCAAGICGPGGTCNEGTNDYSCTCAAGSVKKPGAKVCTDIDDCASMPCGPPEIGTCRDTGANANTCTCAEGFVAVPTDATHQTCDFPIIIEPPNCMFSC